MPVPKRSATVFNTALLLIMPQLCACSLFSPAISLPIDLPPVPDHWQAAFTDLTYRIVYPRAGGDGFEERLVDHPSGLTLRLPKSLYAPVLAYPSSPQGELELPPAGGLYPIDCAGSDGTLMLSWQQGAVAVVMYRLWDRGIACSAVNAERLRREMSDRCQGDPWSLDLQRICAKLAAGEFRLTDIRPAASRDLLLQPGVGQWFLESPFRRPVAADSSGWVLLEAVPLGAHLLFENTGTPGYFLYVEADTVLLAAR